MLDRSCAICFKLCTRRGHDTLAKIIWNIQYIQPPMAKLCLYSAQSFQICSTVISPSGWTVKAAWKCYSRILLFIYMSPSGGLMMWMQEWEIYGYCRPPVYVTQSNNCQLSVIYLQRSLLQALGSWPLVAFVLWQQSKVGGNDIAVSNGHLLYTHFNFCILLKVT